MIAVAGYVAPERDWRRLEIKWNKVLREEDAEFLHTTDLEANPPRGIYAGWSRRKADRLSDRLVPIAARYAGRPYGVRISADTWYSAVPFVKDYLPNRPHDVPYLILSKDCIEQVDSMESSFEEKIAFVFECNDFSQALLKGYRVVKQVSPRPSLLGALAFDEKKGNPMLQAADLLAWHYRRVAELKEQSRLDANTVHRAVFKLLLHPQAVLREVPKEIFCNQVADQFNKNGARWIKQVEQDMTVWLEKRLSKMANQRNRRSPDEQEKK
jgi:hypothetical protein